MFFFAVNVTPFAWYGGRESYARNLRMVAGSQGQKVNVHYFFLREKNGKNMFWKSSSCFLSTFKEISSLLVFNILIIFFYSKDLPGNVGVCSNEDCLKFDFLRVLQEMMKNVSKLRQGVMGKCKAEKRFLRDESPPKQRKK